MEDYRKVLKTQAKERRTVFKKAKGLLRSYYNISEFDEPIAILMRRNQKCDFFEKVTKGNFFIQHSDGNERQIFIDPKFLQTFNYGKHTFKGYILHEDFPTPLPEDPLVTSEMISIANYKTLNDMSQWKAQTKLMDAKTKSVVTYGIIILLGLGVIFLFGKDFITGIIASIGDNNVVQQVAENVSNATAGGGGYYD